MKKDKLEQFFSDKLENFEAPYDANAWTNVASKIGKSGASSGLSNAAKIGWITSAAVIAGLVIYISIFEDKTPTEKPLITADANNQGNSVDKSSNDKMEETNAVTSVENSHTTENNTTFTNSEEITQSAESNTTITPNETSNSTGNQAEISNSNPEPALPSQPASTKISYISGHVSSSLVCNGETITISNLSKEKEVVQFTANNKTIQLTNGKKTTLPIHAATEIRFTNDKNELISSVEIQVLENPHPQFDMDANIYEEGLPVAKFTSYGNYKSISWDFGNGQIASGPEAVTHYFEKGVFPVKLTVTDANGCVGTETKNVEISEKYNLLATNSIRLNDPNLETRTFMPFCLKERGVKFNLTIIDPKDNSVVFTSNDTAKAWDGTDQRTGRLLPAYKTFIWQVQIETPMPGERGIYNGTVTIVE